MLKNLHIKNLALIREIDIDFTEGLNILTGETGAGKSIIIDSITMALGGKTPRNLLREDAPYGLVELVFLVNDPETCEALRSTGRQGRHRMCAVLRPFSWTSTDRANIRNSFGRSISLPCLMSTGAGRSRA